jgi:UDP-N-acetylmuramoyl-tripeptide--D-alanyl-D-alanine ligase
MENIKKIAKRLFQYEAKLVLAKYKPIVIAISGSVGKTVTREMVYSVLSKKHFVRKSEKSFTAELGIPLTIIGCSDVKGSITHTLGNLLKGFWLIVKKGKYPDWLILEIDFDKPGDLKSVSSFLQPDILIMTAIGDVPTHIEVFPGIEEFMNEEEYLLNSVKHDGLIIYNADDARASNLLHNKMVRAVSCGIGKNSDVNGSEFEILYSKTKELTIPTGMSFEITHKSEKHKVNVFGSLGEHNEYAALLSFATGIELKLAPQDIISALNKYTGLPGRMSIITGIKDTTIIDDSYNASPTAMTGAVEVFKELKVTGKKIAIIGDMLELGKYSSVEHRKIADLLDDKIDIIICVGIRTRKIAEEILAMGKKELEVITVDSHEEATKELHRVLGTGDVVLVKGSQAMRLEKVVEAVMKHPEDKGKLLVRQEREWVERE